MNTPRIRRVHVYETTPTHIITLNYVTLSNNQQCRCVSTTTKYRFNIKGVLVFTSARKVSEGKKIIHNLFSFY